MWLTHKSLWGFFLGLVAGRGGVEVWKNRIKNNVEDFVYYDIRGKET